MSSAHARGANQSTISGREATRKLLLLARALTWHQDFAYNAAIIDPHHLSTSNCCT